MNTLSLNLQSEVSNSGVITSTDLVQGRSSNELPITSPVLDPTIAQAVSNALLPVQSLYESAWLLVVQRVQNELNIALSRHRGGEDSTQAHTRG
jgi:hypothetical protein